MSVRLFPMGLETQPAPGRTGQIPRLALILHESGPSPPPPFTRLSAGRPPATPVVPAVAMIAAPGRRQALPAATMGQSRVFTPSPWHLHQTVITTACTGADSIGN